MAQSLQAQLDALVADFVEKIVTTLRTATLQEVRDAFLQEVLAEARITQEGDRFILTLSDGRQYRGTRQRDLVRRARQLGYEPVLINR